MPEFMETIERVRAEASDVRRLFEADAGEIRSGSRGRASSPQYMAQLAEAATLIADVRAGRRPTYLLAEAMTTSDFPNLMGDILDRQLLAKYREFPTSYTDWVKVSQVRDFRTVKRITVDGGQGRLQKIGTIQEESEYPYEALTDGLYSYSVAKYGKKFRFSWEDFINDDLNGLGDTPERMGTSARRTEEYFATDLFFDANGPDATFFASGHKNIVTANPVLSIAGLQTAFTILSQQVDADAEPIMIDAVTLVIPPALQVVAQNILNATELWTTAASAGGATGQELHVMNWMRSKLKLSVAPYIPLVAASANGNTSWLLVAEPSQGRPAAEMGFLRGHTDPEMFQKAPNATRVGGGQSDPMDGDFDTDSIEFKVRHVMGGTLMDSKMAVSSNGSGS